MDFSDIFLEEKALVLPKTTDLNQHAIKLQQSQQSVYKLIYSLGPVELKTLKTYNKTNLNNGFICSSKLPASAFILFIKKSDSSFRLCVDYQGFNNLIIKNQYLLPLIGVSLDQLNQVKRFI